MDYRSEYLKVAPWKAVFGIVSYTSVGIDKGVRKIRLYYVTEYGYIMLRVTVILCEVLRVYYSDNYSYITGYGYIGYGYGFIIVYH